MKIRSFVKSKILNNVVGRNELTDEQILYKFKEFCEGNYIPDENEPSVCFKINGPDVLALMNHELIEKFELNPLIVNRKMDSLLRSGTITLDDIDELLSRHTANMCDVCKSDRLANEVDIKEFGRVYSCFNFKERKIAIHTYLYDKSIGVECPEEFTTFIEAI